MRRKPGLTRLGSLFVYLLIAALLVGTCSVMNSEGSDRVVLPVTHYEPMKLLNSSSLRESLPRQRLFPSIAAARLRLKKY